MKYKVLILFVIITIQACNNASGDRIPPMPTDLESAPQVRLQINYLKALLLENPENDVALYRVAKLYQLMNETENAYVTAKKFTLLKPDNPKYALFLVNCYVQKGLYVDAYDLLEKIKMKISPDEFEKLALEIYLRNGKHQQANELVTKQLKNDPNNNYFITKKAQTAMALKDTLTAIEMYEKALKIDSNDINVLIDLASLYVGKKEYTKSLIISQKALKIDSTIINANFNNAISYKNLGFKDSALFYYQKVLQYDSLHTKALYNTAIIYLQKNEYLKSENYFKKIAKQDQNVQNLNFKLAFILQKQQKFAEALVYYRKIDTLDINYKYARSAIHFLKNVKQ